MKYAFELRRSTTDVQRAQGPARTAATPPAFFFPGGGGWIAGAELSTSLVHCDHGVSAMVVVNGFVDAIGSIRSALAAGF